MKKNLAYTFVLVFALCFPTFAQESCPTIVVKGPDSVKNSGEIITFKANLTGSLPEVTYEWSLTGGNIVGGQGTSAINVDTTGLGNGEITATVIISGFPKVCNDRAFGIAGISNVIVDPLMDEYGKLPFEDEKARLDSIIWALQNDKDVMAIFTFYPGRNESINSFKIRTSNISKYLSETRKISKDRFKFVFGGFENSSRTRIWLAPNEVVKNISTQSWGESINKLKSRNQTPKKTQRKPTKRS